MIEQLVALLAAAAPAAEPLGPPRLDRLKPCYVTVQTGPETYETESLYLSGRGFTPGALVDVAMDADTVAEGVRVRDDGTLPPETLASPPILSGQRRFRLEATERDAPERSAGVSSRVSRLEVEVTPRRARPRQRVRFEGRGFTGRGRVYAHYLRKGELRRTVQLTHAFGACGRFSVRRRQFPFRPEPGTWRVQIDQNRGLSDEGPLINLIVDVRRRAGRG